MKVDPILEEVWRIKDKLSREMASDPDAYFAKLDEMRKAFLTIGGDAESFVFGQINSN